MDSDIESPKVIQLNKAGIPSATVPFHHPDTAYAKGQNHMRLIRVSKEVAKIGLALEERQSASAGS